MPRASAQSASAPTWASGVSRRERHDARRRRPTSARSSGGRSSAPVPVGQREADRRGHPVAAAERAGRPLGDDPAAGDDRDAVGELLGLVHVVRREEDGLAELRAARRSRARRCGAPTGRSRSSARRGRSAPGRRSARARRRAGAAARRRAAARACPPSRRARRARSSRRCRAARGSSRSRARGTRARSAPARRSTPAARRRRGCARRRRRAPGSTPSTLTSPSVRVAEALEDLDGRRLAGAVRPEEGEDLAALDLEVDAGDRLDLAVALAQPADGDDRLHAASVGMPEGPGQCAIPATRT